MGLFKTVAVLEAVARLTDQSDEEVALGGGVPVVVVTAAPGG